MLGIRGIASYLPKSHINNLAAGKQFGESEEFIINKIGGLKLPIKENNEDVSDLSIKSLVNLFKKYPEINNVRIDALVLVTQNSDGEGLPHTSAIIQRKFNFTDKLAAFDISLGCSGYVYGLYVMKGFLEASGLSNGILITCDPYSKIVDKTDKNTALLFGDAAAATWISDQSSWSLGPVKYGTNGSGADYIVLRGGRLNMSGRQVFNFAATNIAPEIKSLLKDSNLSADSIDLYCMHQGSAAIVDAISKQFPEVSNRFVKDMRETGNTVSSSIPLMLEKLIEKEIYQRLLICGFGVGLSWASAIINRVR